MEVERALSDLHAIGEALLREHAALSSNDALAFWRAMHADVFSAQASGSGEYLTVEQRQLLLTPGAAATNTRATTVSYGGDCAHACANAAADPCVSYLVMDVSGAANGSH